MNASEIIKNIENEQLKAEVPQFNVGDTVKVYGKIKEGTVSVSRFSKELLLRSRTEATVLHSQLESYLTVLV